MGGLSTYLKDVQTLPNTDTDSELPFVAEHCVPETLRIRELPACPSLKALVR